VLSVSLWLNTFCALFDFLPVQYSVQSQKVTWIIVCVETKKEAFSLQSTMAETQF